MRIYPAIDIKDKKCVRLQQGDFNKCTVFNDNPVEVAKLWESLGAKYLHLVDLDGARKGSSFNNDIISEIIKNINIPVQIGGGIRTLDEIDLKFGLGADRIILGSVAVKNTELVKVATFKYGDKIIVGIDAKDDMVAVEGWEEISSKNSIELALLVKSFGVKTIIYTDIKKDGMMNGVNVASTLDMKTKTNMDIIASGGVSNMNDLQNVKDANINGVIIGRALYDKTLDLKEVLNIFHE